VFHVKLRHDGNMPYWEGQSLGVTPPGLDANGKPHKVCGSWEAAVPAVVFLLAWSVFFVFLQNNVSHEMPCMYLWMGAVFFLFLEVWLWFHQQPIRFARSRQASRSVTIENKPLGGV